MESGTKCLLASKTFWGLFVVFAGVIAESVPQIEQLIGSEWAGKIGILAGLILAFAGRLTASKAIDRVLPLLLCAAMPLLLGGCGTASSSNAYRAAETLYRGSVEIATDAARSGLMTPDQAVQFEAYRANADAVLDEWGELEAQGRGDEFSGIERLKHLLDAMIELQGGTDGRSSDLGDGQGRGDGRRHGGEARGGVARRWADHGSGTLVAPVGAGAGQHRLARAA